MFNEIDEDFDDMTIRTFKVSLLTEYDLRKSLTKKLVKSVHWLMDRIDEYNIKFFFTKNDFGFQTKILTIYTIKISCPICMISTTHLAHIWTVTYIKNIINHFVGLKQSHITQKILYIMITYLQC